MLSLFPQILFLSPLATTLLRIVAGLFFGYISYRMIVTRAEIERTDMPIVGQPSEWLVWFSALATLAVGILLVVGLWTQAAAILGMIIALKHTYVAKKYPALMPLASSACLLLFVVCLSLLFSGAGAFGVDLPL
jgi:uncharacterized membrane protein YphA (DoxX/SURF4 family)